MIIDCCWQKVDHCPSTTVLLSTVQSVRCFRTKTELGSTGYLACEVVRTTAAFLHSIVRLRPCDQRNTVKRHILIPDIFAVHMGAHFPFWRIRLTFISARTFRPVAVRSIRGQENLLVFVLLTDRQAVGGEVNAQLRILAKKREE